MIYYTSDLHFGHRNVIGMDGRPFETIEEMDETLIRLWNETVTDEDDVYIVGDFAYRNGNTASWYLRQLKGRKHLIIGNHDRLTIQDAKAMEYFTSVEKMNQVIDNNRTVSLCHFPVAEWNGKRHGGYHVHGHLHIRRDEVYEFMSRFDKALNAGCMLNGYRPVTLDELIENNLRFRQEQKRGKAMIDITLLGTSALVPLPDRAETAAQLVCGGHSILFDCGEGTQTAARKAGVSLVKTDMIALTHYHGDHIFGLPGLLQTMNMLGRTERLTIIGPGDIEKELEHMLPLIGWLPYELKLMTIPVEGVELNTVSQGWPDGARLRPFPTVHRVVSQGYVFELPRAGKFMPEKAKALGVPTNQWRFLQKGESVQLGEQTILPEMVMGPKRKGLKVVFSGDTAACEALEQAAEGADLLLCEATYGENDQGQLAADHGHMNFAQAGELAAKAQVKQLWLMHYSQMVEDPMEYLPNAQAHFSNAECGFDGKTVTLQFDH